MTKKQKKYLAIAFLGSALIGVAAEFARSRNESVSFVQRVDSSESGLQNPVLAPALVLQPAARAPASQESTPPPSLEPVSLPAAFAAAKDFQDSKLLFMGDVSYSEGRSALRKIFETPHFKYKLLAFDEMFSSGGDALGTRVFVADHLLVKLKKGFLAQDLEPWILSEGMKIRRTLMKGRLLLVEFPLGGLGALEEAQKKLQSREEIEAIAQDIVKSPD